MSTKVKIDSNLLWTWSSVFIIVMVSGCSFFPKDVSGKGTVVVGRPQVLTRERLVDDRFLESEWLRQQLVKYTPSRQGAIDTRVLTAFQTAIQAKIDPLHGTLDDLKVRNEIESTRQGREINDLRHQIEMQQLRADLEASRQPSVPGSVAAATPAGKNHNEDITAVKASILNLKTDLAELKASAPITSTADLTAIEKINDEKSYRDAVYSMLREKQLDDTHDLLGATLYELKFDISLIPKDGQTDYAIVELEILPTVNQDEDYKSIFNEWLQYVQRQSNKEVIALQEQKHSLTSSELMSIAELLEHRKAQFL